MLLPKHTYNYQGSVADQTQFGNAKHQQDAVVFVGSGAQKILHRKINFQEISENDGQGEKGPPPALAA